jgi:hypothetical protein
VADARGATRIVFASVALAVLVGTAWWTFLSPTGWLRHLLPFLLGGFLLAVALCVLSGDKAFRPLALALCFYCAVGALTHKERFSTHPGGYAYPPGTPSEVMNIYNGLQLTPSPRLADQLKLVEYLDTVKKAGTATLYGCSWWANRDAEYLMQTSGNFKDCVAGDFIKEAKGPPRLLVVDHTYWNWDDNKTTTAVTEFCKSHKVAYESRSYSVYECP